MAAIDTTRFAHPHIINPLGRIFAALASWYEIRQTRNALSQLSDHELADIGLSRCDIHNFSTR